MTFLELIEKILRESDTPLKSRQIWAIAEEKGLDKELPEPTRGERLTPWDTVSAQLSVNLRKDDTIFAKTGKGNFWLKEKLESKNTTELEKLEEDSEKSYDKSMGFDKIKEKDLHPILTTYLYDTQKMYTKTINANKVDSKSGQMKWGTPDMVGVSFTKYDKTLDKLLSQLNISTVSIQAFELKLKINFSNITEYFFQTVSNSSWANESWLVALDIQDDEDFKSELERLNQSFGVGILKLNYDNPLESRVLFSARRKHNLDLDTMDKLMKNVDFANFIDNISDVIDGKDKLHEKLEEKVSLKKFDKPLSFEE